MGEEFKGGFLGGDGSKEREKRESIIIPFHLKTYFKNFLNAKPKFKTHASDIRDIHQLKCGL